MTTQTDKAPCCQKDDCKRVQFPRVAGRTYPGQFMSARISSSDSRWMIELDCPGVRVEDIDISVENRHLVITVDKQVASPPEQANVLVDERFRSQAKRSYRLHEDIDQESIDAELKDGVLTVTLSPRPKSSKSITVRSANHVPAE